MKRSILAIALALAVALPAATVNAAAYSFSYGNIELAIPAAAAAPYRQKSANDNYAWSCTGCGVDNWYYWINDPANDNRPRRT